MTAESIGREAFESLISARMAGEFVSNEEVVLQAGDTKLGVRLVGAAITECVIEDVPVLVAPPEGQLSLPQLMASHAVVPLGPQDKDGVYQNPFRWADYAFSARLTNRAKQWEAIKLTAQTPAGYPTLERRFDVAQDSVSITTTLGNPSEAGRPLVTSMSERLYIATGGGKPGDTEVMGRRINEAFRRPRIDVGDDDGEQYWRSVPHTYLTLPQEGMLRIVCRAASRRLDDKLKEQAYNSLAMLVWHTADAIGWLSVDAIIGARQAEDGSLKRDQLVLPPGASVSIRTELSHSEPPDAVS